VVTFVVDRADSGFSHGCSPQQNRTVLLIP
jgi:hypothetical protein